LDTARLTNGVLVEILVGVDLANHDPAVDYEVSLISMLGLLMPIGSRHLGRKGVA